MAAHKDVSIDASLYVKWGVRAKNVSPNWLWQINQVALLHSPLIHCTVHGLVKVNM